VSDAGIRIETRPEQPAQVRSAIRVSLESGGDSKLTSRNSLEQLKNKLGRTSAEAGMQIEEKAPRTNGIPSKCGFELASNATALINGSNAAHAMRSARQPSGPTKRRMERQIKILDRESRAKE
jgi:hypothetical protein